MSGTEIILSPAFLRKPCVARKAVLSLVVAPTYACLSDQRQQLRRRRSSGDIQSSLFPGLSSNNTDVLTRPPLLSEWTHSDAHVQFRTKPSFPTNSLIDLVSSGSTEHLQQPPPIPTHPHPRRLPSPVFPQGFPLSRPGLLHGLVATVISDSFLGGMHKGSTFGHAVIITPSSHKNSRGRPKKCCPARSSSLNASVWFKDGSCLHGCVTAIATYVDVCRRSFLEMNAHLFFICLRFIFLFISLVSLPSINTQSFL